MGYCYGRVENGVIVLDSDVKLPERARVTVEPVSEPDAAVEPSPTAEEQAGWDSLKQTLLKYSGMADLPADFAKNHDHYIHGAPKHADGSVRRHIFLPGADQSPGPRA